MFSVTHGRGDHPSPAEPKRRPLPLPLLTFAIFVVLVSAALLCFSGLFGYGHIHYEIVPGVYRRIDLETLILMSVGPVMGGLGAITLLRLRERSLRAVLPGKLWLILGIILCVLATPYAILDLAFGGAGAVLGIQLGTAACCVYWLCYFVKENRRGKFYG
jgi:hypothetical protein